MPGVRSTRQTFQAAPGQRGFIPKFYNFTPQRSKPRRAGVHLAFVEPGDDRFMQTVTDIEKIKKILNKTMECS